MESAENILQNHPKILGSLNSYDPKILGRSKKTIEQTDQIVDSLINKLGSEEHKPFYRKVAWKVSEATINRVLESSMRPGIQNQRAYFIRCIKREKEYYSI